MYMLTLHVESTDPDDGDSVTSDKQESVIVQFVTLRKQSLLEGLGDLLSQAKTHPPSKDSDTSHVFVDLGPLSFFEEEEKGYVKDPSTRKSEEHAVRHALALQAEPEFWCKSVCLFLCHL
jgi:hypothetical protein